MGGELFKRAAAVAPFQKKDFKGADKVAHTHPENALQAANTTEGPEKRVDAKVRTV